MSEPPTIIRLHGVVDHAKADAIAARIRAAVRNDRRDIRIDCEQGAVIASPSLLAFLIRAADHLHGRGGHLQLVGDARVLDQLRSLGILARMSPKSDATPTGATP